MFQITSIFSLFSEHCTPTNTWSIHCSQVYSYEKNILILSLTSHLCIENYLKIGLRLFFKKILEQKKRITDTSKIIEKIRLRLFS
jgi:hypothetical protein